MSIEVAGIGSLPSMVRAMATSPRAAPSVSKVTDVRPILVRIGAAAVNSLGAGSSRDAVLLGESAGSLPVRTAGFVHTGSGGGVDLWAGSSRDAVLLGESAGSLPLPTAGFVRKGSDGGVDLWAGLPFL